MKSLWLATVCILLIAIMAAPTHAQEPTEEPTQEPTLEPTTEPTAAATAEPTVTPDVIYRATLPGGQAWQVVYSIEPGEIAIFSELLIVITLLAFLVYHQLREPK